MSRRKPSGFIARCQCGEIVGALDAERMNRADVGKMLGDWLMRGETVEPRFGGTWREHVSECKCSPMMSENENG